MYYGKLKSVLLLTFAIAVLGLSGVRHTNAAAINITGGTLYVPATSGAAGVGVPYAGTLTGADTLSFTETGLAYIQTTAYGTNGGGVVVVAGSVPVGGSENDPDGFAYGDLLLSISGVDGGAFEPLFPTNASTGLGSSSPPSTLILPTTALGTIFGSFSATNPILTFEVNDDVPSDNTGGYTLTQVVPEPASLGFLGIGGLALLTRRQPA